MILNPEENRGKFDYKNKKSYINEHKGGKLKGKENFKPTTLSTLI